MALPCSTWMACACGAHSSLCPLLQLMPCPPHLHLPFLGGEGSLSLRFAETESSWVGPLVWWSLSQVFLPLCLSSEKRAQALGEGEAGPGYLWLPGPSPSPTQVVLVRLTSREGHQLHPRRVELACARVKVNEKLALISPWCQWGDFSNFSIYTVNPQV